MSIGEWEKNKWRCWWKEIV